MSHRTCTRRGSTYIDRWGYSWIADPCVVPPRLPMTPSKRLLGQSPCSETQERAMGLGSKREGGVSSSKRVHFDDHPRRSYGARLDHDRDRKLANRIQSLSSPERKDMNYSWSSAPQLQSTRKRHHINKEDPRSMRSSRNERHSLPDTSAYKPYRHQRQRTRLNSHYSSQLCHSRSDSRRSQSRIFRSEAKARTAPQDRFRYDSIRDMRRPTELFSRTRDLELKSTSRQNSGESAHGSLHTPQFLPDKELSKQLRNQRDPQYRPSERRYSSQSFPAANVQCIDNVKGDTHGRNLTDHKKRKDGEERRLTIFGMEKRKRMTFRLRLVKWFGFRST